MFGKKRALEVKVVKRDKATTSETSNCDDFKEKASFVMHELEGVAAKMFLGVCVYILLDTYRQVQIAKNSNPTS